MAAGAAIGADARRAALTVAQFNVLADGLAGMQTKPSFTECPTAALSWTYRSKRIIEELTRHGVMPDVIALEEVDHFHDDLLPALQRLGYAGAFEAKPDSPCKRSLDPTLEDGCALFWREERLDLSRLHRLNYTGTVPPGGVRNNQVALLAELRLRDAPGRPLLVGVTHLAAAKQEAGESLRRQQVIELLDFCERHREDHALVLAMDMNGAPTRGETAASDVGYEPRAYPAALAHSVDVKSAYAMALGSEPKFTTWKVRGPTEVQHTIDYILVSSDVGVRRVLLPPDEAEVEDGRLPSWRYPSDHVMLCAELHFDL